MPAGPQPVMSRPRLVMAVGLTGTIFAAVVCAALAASGKPVVVTDPSRDVAGALDITRVSLQRASDGRLRSVITFAGRIAPSALLASSGPPGSACLRIWTAADADASATRPDRLVCVTARSSEELRGGVYEVAGAALPERLADASVKRTKSRRSLVVRFAQSALGRPRRIRFAAESTRAGCVRASCIDRVPRGRGVRTLRLR